MQFAQPTIALVFALLLQLAGLTFVVAQDHYIRQQDRVYLLATVGFALLLVFQNLLDYRLPFISGNPFWFTLVAWVGYVVRPIILACFLQIIQEDRWPWILCFINAGIYSLSFGSTLVVWYDPDGSFHRGPLGYCCHVVSFVLLVWLILKIRERYTHEGMGLHSIALPLLITGFIAVGTFMDSYFSFSVPVSMLTVAIVTSCVFYYIWLHEQFIREHEEELQAQQRIRIMMSQIQPHFLFNTLSTIQALCLMDPAKAADTVGKFGQYLRQNIDSLNQPDLILFEKELEYTKIYADIEQIRFPNINVEYDIQDTHFGIPALSLQPLVENAIRHGVRGRQEGRILVTTRLEGDAHVLKIQDNGKGFDVAAAMAADSSHIGMRNVMERIEKMTGGSVTIDSRIGEGTDITVRIPVRKE